MYRYSEDWAEEDRMEVEFTYASKAREAAAVPCDAPMILGHCGVPGRVGGTIHVILL
jgi:hypothetical protein